jgi:hypothetical protein
VETAADFELDRLQYQFKPYSQSDKYIAVINGEIALKVGITHCMMLHLIHIKASLLYSVVALDR